MKNDLVEDVENKGLESNEELQNAELDTLEILDSTSADEVKAELSEGEPKAEPEYEQSYSAENSELDNLLAGSSEKAEPVAETNKTAVGSSNSDLMSKEEASEYTVTAVIETVRFASEQLGSPLKISKLQLGLASTLLVPVTMKYGNVVKKYIENMADGIDENSYLPEYMAIGAGSALGVGLWWQHRKITKAAAKA